MKTKIIVVGTLITVIGGVVVLLRMLKNKKKVFKEEVTKEPLPEPIKTPVIENKDIQPNIVIKIDNPEIENTVLHTFSPSVSVVLFRPVSPLRRLSA